MRNTSCIKLVPSIIQCLPAVPERLSSLLLLLLLHFFYLPYNSSLLKSGSPTHSHGKLAQKHVTIWGSLTSISNRFVQKQDSWICLFDKSVHCSEANSSINPFETTTEQREQCDCVVWGKRKISGGENCH